ncbi:hypothetical protein HYV84_00065 [Candidatus Woesearchaeota archaeon]|nr:hypothetical protein [Candidatus Woesearchaeota archaeon]
MPQMPVNLGLESLCLGEIYSGRLVMGSGSNGRDFRVLIDSGDETWRYWGYLTEANENHSDFSFSQNFRAWARGQTQDPGPFPVRVWKKKEEAHTPNNYYLAHPVDVPEDFTKFHLLRADAQSILGPGPGQNIFPAVAMYRYDNKLHLKAYLPNGEGIVFFPAPYRISSDLQEDDPKWAFARAESELTANIIERLKPGSQIIVRKKNVYTPHFNLAVPVVNLWRKDLAYRPDGERLPYTSMFQDPSGRWWIFSLPIVGVEKSGEGGNVGVGYVPKPRDHQANGYYRRVVVRDFPYLGGIVNVQAETITPNEIVGTALKG